MDDGEDERGGKKLVKRCPMRPRLTNPDDINRIVEAYNWMKEGFLPDGGTWLDQTPKFAEVCSIITSATADADKFLDDLKPKGK